MMPARGYRLPVRLLGIPVYLDLTFLVILPLLVWAIGSRLDTYLLLFRLPVDPLSLQQGTTPYLLGLAAALGLFASVLVHELGHAAVAQRFGVRTRRITLWLLGGIAEMEQIPRARGAEAVVAIAGPLTSLGVAALARLGLALAAGGPAALQFVLGYLAFMNLVLALFNLLPALPLDGGRVLRSLLALRVSHLQATRAAAGVGRVVALLLGLYGFASLNVFLLLIAFFIFMAGGAETQHAVVAEALEGVRVEDVMTRDVQTVPPDLPIAALVQKMLRERHLGYPVVDAAGRLSGMVSLADIQGADPDAPVGQVMTRDVLTVLPAATAMQAFERMSRNNFGRLVVVDRRGEIVGILSKTDLIRTVQVRVVGLELQPEPTKT